MEQRWERILALFSRPVVAPLLGSRVLCAVCACVGAAQVGLTAAGQVTFQCPFATVLHIPCPGCGLSRACAALISGDLCGWLYWHPFAPFFLIAIVLFIWMSFAGVRQRRRIRKILHKAERRTGLSALLLSAMLLYWLIRLVYFSGQYGELISTTFRTPHQ